MRRMSTLGVALVLLILSGCGGAASPTISVDADHALDKIIEDFKLNFGQASWAGSVDEMELTIAGDTAGLEVRTNLYPKASNEQPARALCMAVLGIAQDVTQAPRVNILVTGQGDNMLLSCHIEPGQAIRWEVYSALKKS